MDILQIRFLITILSVVLALPAQATTLKNLKSFDSTNTVQYLQSDWNPSDGDTHWGDIRIDKLPSSSHFRWDPEKIYKETRNCHCA